MHTRDSQVKKVININRWARIAGITLVVIAICVAAGQRAFAQDERFSVMFYNVENLFDTIDSDLDDDEFLPGGTRRWGSYRYYSKLNSIYKVIVSVNSWSLPRVIGLCEVENQGVIEDLVKYTYLSGHSFKAIYAGSKDERGIGVALLVDTSLFSIDKVDVLYPVDRDGSFITTRSVLMARVINNTDSITLLVTHWPSRRGGAAATDKLRERVAVLIADQIYSIRREYGNGEKIIIMGDLNTEPDEDVITRQLGATAAGSSITDTSLCNLSLSVTGAGTGSYKYQGIWLNYDQVIISGSFYTTTSGYRIARNGFHIFNPVALLTPDKRFNGMKPFSTWSGPVYLGGFSDHLPVVATFIKVDQPDQPE